jgi:hypothetical protein
VRTDEGTDAHNTAQDLVDMVGRLAAEHRFDELRSLRDRCRQIGDDRHRVIASIAEYRLVLDGPPALVADVLVHNGGDEFLAPLAEVAAQHHSWAELAELISSRTQIARHLVQNRALRGELVEQAPADWGTELPVWLEPWEPSYGVATFGAVSMEHPRPVIRMRGGRWRNTSPGEPIGDPYTNEAVALLTQAWRGRRGSVDVLVVEGDEQSAVAALGVRPHSIAEIRMSDAFAAMAWIGGSGGPDGGRRGAAFGRYAAWWTAAALTGLTESWPVHPDDLRDAAGALRWFIWSEDRNDDGFRLAVHDPIEELGTVVRARRP